MSGDVKAGCSKAGSTTPPRLILLCLLSLGSTPGCSESEGVAASTPETAPIQARVLQVTEQAWPQVVATQGNLIADETSVVGAKVAGRVDEVLVDMGDLVETGTVMASLDLREHQERVRQAEAELAQSRAAIGLDADDDLAALDPNASPVVIEQKALWDQALADRNRVETLRSRQVATDAQYDTVIATEQVARARHASAINSVREKIALVRVRATQLELARQMLDDSQIRAPFSGRVQVKHVSPGTYVPLGNPVVTLIRDDPLRYRGTVPEPYASSLVTGLRVRLKIDAGPALPEVTITRISPTLDPLSRSLLFEARVPNSAHAIQAGQFCQGEVVLDQSRRAIAVPKSAIVAFAGTQKVWKLADGQAEERVVETGATRDGLVEILDGITSGDQVLIDGTLGRPARVEIEEVVTTAPRGADIGLRESNKPR